MRWRNALRFRNSVLLTFHSETGMPYSLRVRTRGVVWGFSLFLTAFGCLLMGTLLFFREMETTRELESRVLQLEIEARLQQDLAKLPIELKQKNYPVSTKDSKIEVPVPRTLTGSEPQAKAKPAPKSEAKSKAKSKAAAVAPTPLKPVWATPKLRDVSVAVEAPFYKVKATVVREKKGENKVRGSAVVVLEALDPLSGKPQFYLYPGYKVRRTFNEKSLAKIKGNGFRFSTLFPLTVKFTVKKELLPTKVTVYLKDAAGKLIATQTKNIPAPEPSPVAKETTEATNGE